MKKSNLKTGSGMLRKKAEELLGKKSVKTLLQLSQSETLKLIHELEVYQIELEIQNEELKKAKEYADVSSEKYTELYNFAPSGYLTLSREGLIIDLNLTASNLLRKESSLLISNSFGFFVSVDTRPDFNLFLSKVFKNKSKESCEITLSVNVDNPVNIHLIGIANKNGEECLVTMVDITSLKRIEETLRDNEHQLSTIYNTVDDIIFHLEVEENGNFRFISVNKAFYRVTGMKPEMVIGKLVNEVIPEPSLSMVLEKYRMAIKENSIIRWEEVSDYPTGRLIGDVSIAPVFDDKGSCTHLVGSVHDITERKQAEYLLSKSEEKFRKAFIISPDSININRLKDGMYVSINEGFTKIMGYSEEDVIGRTSVELNIWADPGDRKRLVNGLKSDGQVENLEASFVSKDGTIKYGMMSAAIINLDGVKHILSITRDVTDRKNAALALQASENRYRELIELAVDGILLGSPEGIITGANSYILSLTGRSLDHLIGLNISELFQKDDLQKVPLRFDLLQKGETLINERNIVRQDGKIISVEMHSKMMPDGSYQSIFHDITRRRATEKALRESEERFRNLFEKSSDGIFYLSLNGEIKAVNNSFAKMHGYTLNEIQKMNISDLDCEDISAVFHSRIQRLIEGENLKFEVEHFHKDGHRIPLEVTTSLIELGSSKYIMASHRDITERLQANDAIKVARTKAEASDKLKTSFLNNISHEVRTPLNGILGFAEIISSTDLSPEEREEALEMVHESSNRLLDTITNYMDISLLVSGEMTVTNMEFSPQGLMNELFEKHNTFCIKRNIELLLHIPPSDGNMILNSDHDLISKVLTHLISNAVKFTEKGTIQIGYSAKKDEFVFFVFDTGIGISKGSEEIVFDHFEKEEQNKSKHTEGSGLGLSISKGIVELLGGKIWMESEPGKGTRFYFSIPMINIPVYEFIKPDDNLKNNQDKLKLVLVAEDDAANFMYISALLRQSTTAEIIHASNGKEAVEKFIDNPGIEIVLMDMKMPEMNGFEATQKIKAINPDVPVIAITAYAMLGDERRILDAGCDAYLSKPISRERLLEKLNAFVSV